MTCLLLSYKSVPNGCSKRRRVPIARVSSVAAAHAFPFAFGRPPSHASSPCTITPPRLSSRHSRAEPAKCGARRVLPAQNPHEQISLRKPLVQVAGMRPLRRSPLCSLHRRRNPRTAPDHEAVAQGDRRKTRRSSWEIGQSSPRRSERSGYTCINPKKRLSRGIRRTLAR